MVTKRRAGATVRPIPLKRSVAIHVPRSYSTTEKGTFLEGLAAQLLRRQSYTILEQVRFTGMEIDLLASHEPSGDQVYVECKFLSGSVSANVLDNMVGQAFRRKINRLALFTAGDLGKEAKGAAHELRQDNRISFSHYGPLSFLDALVATGSVIDLGDVSIPHDISHAHLLVFPGLPFIWLLQQQDKGHPHRIIPVCGERLPVGIHKLREILDECELLEGLSISEQYQPDVAGSPILPSEDDTERVSQLAEVVGQVITADAVLDYRPCRPEDFVGRRSIQKEIWDFLLSVSEGNTQTRLVSIVGASGYGKSSLVAKLAERFRNKKWKNRLYLFPVDVRSARGPRFISEAILEAIKSASAAGFIEGLETASVTDIDNILSGAAIQGALEYLRRQKRVLVVFFDQFEEVFTKDELLPLFRSFRRFALQVSAEKGPVVIGFSWRTGIYFSDDNPAYALWNDLRDHRLTKNLDKFDQGESSRLIAQFEEVLGTKLLSPLRKRILEQGQGLPWLLKKLCIHINDQLQRDVSQMELLGSRLNVQSLFDADLENLSEPEVQCIKFVAENSPVDSLELYDRHSDDTISRLLAQRLVVKTGQRFAVYWDIFRDYLVEDKVPNIPWSYVPSCTQGMILAAFRLLLKAGPLSTGELADQLGYTEKTTLNIVTDLQNLAMCERSEDGTHGTLQHLGEDDLASHVRGQFAGHIFYAKLMHEGRESGSVARQTAIRIVKEIYPGTAMQERTRETCVVKLASWLDFCGLTETDVHRIEVLSAAAQPGRNYGKLPKRGRGNRKSVFLACATPEAALQLLERIAGGRRVTKKTVRRERLRNVVVDLIALGIVVWKGDKLTISRTVAVPDRPIDLLRQRVLESEAMSLLLNLSAEKPGMTRAECGTELGLRLGKEWKPSSSLRYANGLHRYRNFCNI